MPVSREQVIWMYRCILGREPEGDAVIDAWLATTDFSTLRRSFLGSAEFLVGQRSNWGHLQPPASSSEPSPATEPVNKRSS